MTAFILETKSCKEYIFGVHTLQDIAGLTFKEARAYINKYHMKNKEDLAKEFDITPQAVYNLERKAKIKVAASMLTNEDIFGDKISMGLLDADIL